ncbi:hypothetical protein DSL72_008519 [Monilinia vaccinii-corymbosi]|uniref:Major facilitator superfamily (MFS) profile domain-containing protein n=1 Tax=Monilinia vaccinii-corymbosi TaxID=61207 RepID=A0A8A3PKZ6_9HELO|nr:hypothetical protein DSL72_008519 [Monilinia vaccinii-corymbosi]
MSEMPPLSSIVLAIQGGFNLLNGVCNLLSPWAAARSAEVLAIESIPAIHTIALGSISIGTFYLIAAHRRDRLVMWLSVMGRTIAVGVFVIDAGPWRNIAIFEGVCGGLLAGSLVWGSQDVKGKNKQ